MCALALASLGDKMRGVLNRLLLLCAFLLASCTREEAAPAPVRLTVFAAASLRESFEALARSFEAGHPGTRVALSFGGSQELRTQVEQGARADVFASADAAHLEALGRAGHLAEEGRVFAHNTPVLVVSAAAVPPIASLAELPRARRIVLGAAEVPIGRYTARLLDNAAARLGADFRARVEARVVSRELNVRQVLAKVALGEADAGVVYRTDARTAAPDAVRVVELPADVNVVADYPLAPLKASAHPALARAFVAHVLSPEGQAALARAGFTPVGTGAAR